MAKTRRDFTPEFKREAVALLESSGRPQMQIAAELGTQPSMLRQWRTTLNGAAFRSQPGATPGIDPGETRCFSVGPGGRDRTPPP